MIIVFNPAAGMRRASLLWRVLDVLVANGVRIELAETHRPGHAEALAREAVCRGASMVVAAGGDGTIAEVANGLLGSSARLGVIPLGSANVMAHELSLPFEPRAVAAALAFGRTRPLWPGVARGANGSRLFVQMLGVGFDAQVVHRLPVMLKRALGRGAYAVQTLRELALYRFTPIRLRVDGEETQAASVIVSKGRLYGGRFLLAPTACATQPGFSVVLFDRGSTAAALLYGAALPLGVLARAPGVRHVRAREIDFIGNEPSPVQVDGDAAGWTPITVTDAPASIPVVVG
ncbi:MAG TPA: diacylglycerol kinase family protein [Acetobacteraceae bacterium]|nr:diacylglycerol kinase family protein [Acetobacteraceae bacterium]